LGDDRNAFFGEELLQNKRCRNHHDNAPSHTSLVVQQFLAEKSIPVITKPPHSPNLVPNDLAVPKDSKRSLPPMLPTMAGSLEQVCVRAQGYYFESD
jgi:hypothetical protein